MRARRSSSRFEQARGTPLAALAVKVTDGFFRVGRFNVESGRSRNLQLLKERSWFDVPLVYVDQRRAIIAAIFSANATMDTYAGELVFKHRLV